jgi:hypothetical protein
MGPMGLTPAVWDLFFKPQAGGRAAASARSGLGSGGGFRPAGGAPVALAPRLSGACGPSASSVQRHLGRSGLCGAGRASQAPLPALLLPLHPLPPRLGSLGPRRCRGQPPRVAAQHHPAQVPGRHPGGRQRLRPSGPGRRPSAPQVVRCGGAAVGAYLVHACVRGPPSVAAATEAVHGGCRHSAALAGTAVPQPTVCPRLAFRRAPQTGGLKAKIAMTARRGRRGGRGAPPPAAAAALA